MLPGLTTLAVVVHPLLRLVQRGLVLLLPVVLVFSLSACGAGAPSQKVLLSALALQIDLTQRSIADALTLEAAGPPQVSRVRVESQDAMTIDRKSVV